MKYENNNLRQLPEHHDELENYFQNTIIPQLYVDEHLHLQRFTPPAARHFGLCTKDIGKAISDLNGHFYCPAFAESIGKVMSSRQIFEQEIQATNKRWYQMDMIPCVCGTHRKINGVIISFVDITQRIKTLNELEKVIADYEILLDSIAHDIRNPFASLVMAVDFLKTASGTDKAASDTMINIVDNSVKRMYKVFTELTATCNGAHKYQPVDELVSFEHVLEDVKLTLHESLLACGAKIENEIQVPAIVYPERKLRSILYNLVNNAIKFRAPGRQLTISIGTFIEESFIVTSVKDNGMGIAPGSQRNIFQKHYRINQQMEGSGVGLYLVNEMVKGSGGKIIVNSELDKGTEFRIYFKQAG